ncbi:hypothetical protein CTEN210_04337 [Chaetoceros tenuissimus]|uniref:SCP domain-containing protein n=1 Tax=Chaetoceros tenuissimus TaxID=426638 RepID=A0AAD3CL00_9STRA|nr:hypothetical protein CTEN210_04337 [Chaetoceros tenuissimus]
MVFNFLKKRRDQKKLDAHSKHSLNKDISSSAHRLTPVLKGISGSICCSASFARQNTIASTLVSSGDERSVLSSDSSSAEKVIDLDTGAVVSSSSPSTPQDDTNNQEKHQSSSVHEYKWMPPSNLVMNQQKSNSKLQQMKQQRSERKKAEKNKLRIDQAGRFGANSVLINVEREKHHLKNLNRDLHLHAIATDHAKAMAENDCCFHSDPQLSIQKVMNASGPIRFVGENVTVVDNLKGCTRDAFFYFIALDKNTKANILNENYTSVGVASATSTSGKLYVVQMFMG